TRPPLESRRRRAAVRRALLDARLVEISQGPVVVPHDRLTPETLRALAEEFVTREGTDYGPVERSFAAKGQRVLRQIASGGAAIIYDGASDRTHVVRRDRMLASLAST